jgi:type II secretory pathway pseudopilin PulG
MRDGKQLMRKRRPQEQGFTLLEALIVIGIMFTLAGIAVIQSFGSLQAYKANSAQDTVVSQLRVARQLAISQRRFVQVQFNTLATPPTVSYTVLPRINSGDAAQAPVTVVLPQQTGYMQESGTGDTPMAFGTCGSAGICIAGTSGGPAFMQFTSSGQFTDSTGVNPIDGTVFIGISNNKNTARAVTIMGATGRVRPYTYVGGTSGWIE